MFNVCVLSVIVSKQLSCDVIVSAPCPWSLELMDVQQVRQYAETLKAENVDLIGLTKAIFIFNINRSFTLSSWRGDIKSWIN